MVMALFHFQRKQCRPRSDVVQYLEGWQTVMTLIRLLLGLHLLQMPFCQIVFVYTSRTFTVIKRKHLGLTKAGRSSGVVLILSGLNRAILL